MFGIVVFLLLLCIAAIGARSAVDGSNPTVPAPVPFRYTIVAGDTVASVSSLFAADSVEPGIADGRNARARHDRDG